ncbi:MAG: copper transporter [Pedosphaera sp.]|nr:copper transporter [Pedosphaera sp.]
MKLEIVIAGGGFAGAYCAKTLSHLLGPQGVQRIGLIAEQNIMVFQPLLAEVAGSSLSPLDVVNPLRLFCRGVNVFRGRITDVDLAKRQLTLDAGSFTSNTMIEFEHLVLALGSVVDLSRVPGMPEHALVLKGVGDALQIRRTVINRLEEANLESDHRTLRQLLTFVVVGGGFSGVETAGQILDLARSAKPYYHNLRDETLRVVLVHSGPWLLPEVGESLGRYAEKKLRQRGMEIILNTRATSMTASKIFLENGQTIETATVLSTVGNAPQPLILDLAKKFGLETIKGRIVTEPTCKVKGAERLWAAGDCAAVPVNGKPASPPLAQFAQRQGELLAKNIVRHMHGESLQPFAHKNLGQLASIGHHTAVADIMGFQFSGFIAWWIWRSIYLFKLPGLQRKLRLMIDWTMDLFFPREISVLVPDPTNVVQEMYLDKGDVVFHAGEPAFSFYIVKEGRVDFLDGSEPVQSMTRGQHFGARGLLGDGVWHHKAVAAEATILVSISRKAFLTLAESSTAFRQSLAHVSPQNLPPRTPAKSVGPMDQRTVEANR